MSSTERQLKSIGSVASSTVASGFLGLASNVLLASHFGRGMATDGLFMAQSLLRVFGKMFQSGPLRMVVMPIFVEAQAKDSSPTANRYASNVITLVILALGAISIGLWFASPWIVGMIAPGFAEEPKALTLVLTRLLIPVVVCTVLISLLTAFLHAAGRFALTEWLARVPSVFLIGTLVWGAGRWPIHSVAWALVVGSVVQLGVLWLSLRRTGLRYRPAVDWQQPELKMTRQRLLPFVGSSIAVQIQLVVHRLVCSMYAVGTLSAFSYADRLYHFLGVLLGAIPMVLFPQFIREALTSSRAELCRRLGRAVVLMSLVTFPLVVMLAVFSKPIVTLLFQRGRFDVFATQDTALALSWLAIGLLGWPTWDLCKMAAFAIQRPGIVNRTIIVSACGTGLLSLTIGRAWGLAGLSIAWAATPSLMAIGYLWLLRHEIPQVHRIVWNQQFLRLGAATLGMAGLCWVLRETVWTHFLARSGTFSQALGLGLLGLVGVGGYWVFLGCFRVDARHDAFRTMRQFVGLSRSRAAAVTS